MANILYSNVPYFNDDLQSWQHASIVQPVVNFSLSWGPQHQHFSNYFILNPRESLHNNVPIVTAGCMFLAYTNLRLLKGGFSTLIHIYVQKNFICYAFEGHINISWGPHLDLGCLLDSPAL